MIICIYTWKHEIIRIVACFNQMFQLKMMIYECLMLMLMLCKSSYARLTPEVLHWVGVTWPSPDPYQHWLASPTSSSGSPKFDRCRIGWQDDSASCRTTWHSITPRVLALHNLTCITWAWASSIHKPSFTIETFDRNIWNIACYLVFLGIYA